MAWTMQPSLSRTGNYKFLTLKCVSSAAGVTTPMNMLSETYMPRDIKSKIQGHTLMEVKCDPGPAGTKPAQAWSVTFSDRDGDALLTLTSISQTVPARHDFSTDIGEFPTIEDIFYVTFPTSANFAAGDTVYLRFKLWIEPGSR